MTEPAFLQGATAGVDDQALVARVLDGNERAFADLYTRYEPLVSRHLRRVLGRLQDVEDVLQVTFVEAYKNLGRYDPSRPFGPWIQGIAFRQAANHLRRAKRRAWLRFESQDEKPIADLEAVSSEDQAIQRQLLELMYRAMAKLPAKKRIAFSLHVLEGMGFTEIGEVVDASPQTVRARVLSARKAVLKDFSRMTNLPVAKMVLGKAS